MQQDGLHLYMKKNFFRFRSNERLLDFQSSCDCCGIQLSFFFFYICICYMFLNTLAATQYTVVFQIHKLCSQKKVRLFLLCVALWKVGCHLFLSVFFNASLATVTLSSFTDLTQLIKSILNPNCIFLLRFHSGVDY